MSRERPRRFWAGLGRLQSIHADLGADTCPNDFLNAQPVYFPFPTFTRLPPTIPDPSEKHAPLFSCSFLRMNERSVDRWFALETQLQQQRSKRFSFDLSLLFINLFFALTGVL